MTGAFTEVPLEDLTRPRDGAVLCDRWWLVKDGRALLWRGKGMRGYSPQCNSDKRAADLFAKRHPEASVQFVPVAYMGHEDEEWGWQMRWLESVETVVTS